MRSVREQCVLFVLCFVILEVVPEQPRYKMIMLGLQTKPAPFLTLLTTGQGWECAGCVMECHRIVSSHCVIILTNNDMQSGQQCCGALVGDKESSVLCSLGHLNDLE